MRSTAETNAIDRVLKARGLGSLDDPGVVERLARQVEGHEHFMTLLRACDPTLRRDMYEAMRPHLRFLAKPLDDYIIAAKERAEAGQFPTVEPDGNLKPFSPPVCQPILTCEDEEPGDYELWVMCMHCDREIIFLGDHRSHCIRKMRQAGWTYDESIYRDHRCPECRES